MTGSDYNYQLLANAIVEQAADDYFNLIAGFAKQQTNKTEKHRLIRYVNSSCLTGTVY